MLKHTAIKTRHREKYADSVRGTLRRLAHYIRWVRSQVRSLQVCYSLTRYQRLKEDRGGFIFQDPVIHLSLHTSLSDCLSLSLSLRIGRNRGGQNPTNPHGFRARSQASSLGNYPELAGHLTQLTLIYVALCTENRIRDQNIDLAIIYFTLLILPWIHFNIIPKTLGGPRD